MGKTMLGMGGAALAGFGLAVKSAADFEKTLSAVQAVLGVSDQAMKATKQLALDLGSSTKFSAQDIAQGMEDMAKAGLTVQQITGGATQGVIALASAAGDMKLDVAAEIAVNAMKTFNLSAGDLTHVADVMAGAANASTLEVDDLAVSLKYAGAVAKTVGLTIDDTATALAVLGDRGIRGSTAGTSLRGVLLSLNPTSKKAASAMKELGLITEDGKNKFFNARGEMKSFGEVMQILQDHTKGLSEQQRNSAFNIIFQRRAMASALILAEQGKKGFDDYAASIRRVSAADVAAKKLDNLAGDITILKTNIQTMLISAGSPFQDQLREWVQLLTKLTKAFTDLSPETQKTIMKVLAYGGAAMTAMGATSLIVGRILKFAKAMKQLGAAAVWTSNKLGLLTIVDKLKSSMETLALKGMYLKDGLLKAAAGARAFTAALLTNPVFLIVAAIAALAAGIYLLYKKWKPFHDFVDSAWQSFQVGWDIVLGFSRDLLDKLGGAVQAVGGFFAGLGRAFMGAINFFQELPGKILSFLADLPGKVASFFAQLPERVAGALGFLLGRAIRIFIQLHVAIFHIVQEIVDGVVDFFQKLPGRVIGFVDMLWDGAWGAFFAAKTKLLQVVSDIVEGVADFFQKLPGRVVSFVNSTWDSAWDVFFRAKTRLIEVTRGAVDGIVDFFVHLPGRIWDFVSKIGPMLWETMLDAGSAAWRAITGVLNDIVTFFREFPGKVWDAISGMASTLWQKMKDIGSSAWEGFKKGLFGSPKTKIQYALEDLLTFVEGFNYDMGAEMAKLHAMTYGGLSGLDPAAAALQAAPASAGSQTVTNNYTDNFKMIGVTEKTARENSKEIMYQKRVRIRV